MSRFRLLLTIVALSIALPVVARPQQDQSLGDVARQLREQRAKDTKKATKVFTNDNLPSPKPMEPVTTLNASTESPSQPAQSAAKPAAPAGPEEAKNKPLRAFGRQSQNPRLLARQVQIRPSGRGPRKRTRTIVGR